MTQPKPMTVGRFTFTEFRHHDGISVTVTIARDGKTITSHNGVSGDALSALLDALRQDEPFLALLDGVPFV